MNTHDFNHESVSLNAGPAEVKVAWTKPVLIEMSVMEGTEANKGSEVSESSTTKNTS
jgi:hypothetical protein